MEKKGLKYCKYNQERK